MLGEIIGQRTFAVFLNGLVLVVLYIVAVLSGRNPLELPIDPEGNVITPENIILLFTNLIIPAGLLITTLNHLLRGITTKVTTESMEANNLVELLKQREFWIQVVATVLAGLQMFNIRFWEEGQEEVITSVIVNIIMGFLNNLQASYVVRPHGVKYQIVGLEQLSA